MRSIFTVTVVVAVAAGAFIWGYFAHRNKLFPYSLLTAGAQAAGMTDRARTIVQPRNSRVSASMLASLPYSQTSFDPSSHERGVLHHDRELAFAGLNFYSSVRSDEGAKLINMEGDVVHEWRRLVRDGWHHAELLPNGDVIIVIKDDRVERLDKDSNVLWSYETRAHHDVWVREDGAVYVISRETISDPSIHPELPALVDAILLLSPDGELLERFSLYEALRNSGYDYLIPSAEWIDAEAGRLELDVMHTNHVESFDGSLESVSPLFRKGNVLVSMKFLNSIAILDPTGSQVLWLWGPNNIVLQHHPRLLDNGHILVFDNGTEASRVVEVEVPSGRVVWSYGRGPDEGFFSSWGGGNQRLPNGNTLITNSDGGRAFEVTPDHRVVWEFANPVVSGDGMRWNLWRLERTDPAKLTFLEQW